ncbi:MAG: hypothetical protein DRJ56_00695 [Thermoprotei archaeon]|nr:MAG: hypothetical protein DRJ56_00695 [Thermoprotei archaeon]
MEVVLAAYLSRLRRERVRLPLGRASIRYVRFEDFPQVRGPRLAKLFSLREYVLTCAGGAWPR